MTKQSSAGRGSKDYPVPEFLKQLGIAQDDYGTWLDRITIAHSVRDAKRLKKKINREAYRKAIHKAVCDSGGRDAYTGQALDFRLLQYFAGAVLDEREENEVPTLDHVILDAEKPVFAICSLQTNKCKADLSIHELITFCETFLAFQKRGN